MVRLYLRGDCPFCQKVLDAVAALGWQEGIHFQAIDAAPGTPGREVVLRLGGKPMVPFLVDGATTMYESGDIIAYLQTKVVEARPQ